jgi:hypothetical protein
MCDATHVRTSYSYYYFGTQNEEGNENMPFIMCMALNGWFSRGHHSLKLSRQPSPDKIHAARRISISLMAFKFPRLGFIVETAIQRSGTGLHPTH